MLGRSRKLLLDTPSGADAISEVKREINYWTDHRLVVSKLNLRKATHGREIDICFLYVEEAYPTKIQDVSIINIFKRKGNPQVRDNQRGNSLLSIVEKLLEKSIEWSACLS